MHQLPSNLADLPDIPPGSPRLNYEAPIQGKNFWILENALPNALQVAKRCYNLSRWKKGFPYTQEKWPGMRAKNALKTVELTVIENWVKSITGVTRLWVAEADGGAKVDFNVAQLVGEHEASALPHTDSRNLCRFAAVLYLCPKPDPLAGTTFYRLRYPNGAAGGNLVKDPYLNLRDALNVQGLPAEAWYEEVKIENVFNRLLLYKANMVHSATRYFGEEKRDKRLTSVFFWMADID